MSLTVGSLFSGIGGFDLGFERAGFEIAWQVEIDDYCRQVLGKHWPKVPCHYDITKIDWEWVGRVDLVCGGFPCQPFSLAGKQRGEADDRYLWPEVVRCLDALRPAWFLGENVPGLIKMALDQVCADLESLGYTVWPVCVPACAVDAPHQRERVWIVAHAACQLPHGGGTCRARWEEPANSSDVPYASSGCQQSSSTQCNERGLQDQALPSLGHPRNWPVEPAVGRVAHGVSARVDRLRGLGNAVVPQVVEALASMILSVHGEGVRR